MRLDRPIGTFLLLWPTLWALWIASAGHPDIWVAVVFVVGVFLMRSAGCVINDYADRDLDPFVERTRQRPLASGLVSPREALLLFAGLGLLAFLLVLTLNWLTIALSVVGIVLAVSYPFMKRHTYLPQVYLGLAFGWAVPMAFAAQTGAVPAVAWLLLIATVLWATAYDTMYAMVDRPDDLKIGVKSTAILFGEADRVIIGIIQGMMVVVLLIIGQRAELGKFYIMGVAVTTLLMAYQQYLIRDRDGMGCFKAFLNNNWVGIAVFAGLAGHYLSAP
ncbi:MAG: 4-hydroxybenzoate octaprenyltransferase [Gammaproteobacteria bacterium]|nr:4-hydroxybenzoate octaprenyltransferase [Gammaproteobacteria bacterium]